MLPFFYRNDANKKMLIVAAEVTRLRSSGQSFISNIIGQSLLTSAATCPETKNPAGLNQRGLEISSAINPEGFRG